MKNCPPISYSGWQSRDALRLTNAVHDLDIYIEQPCPTYQECLRVRKHTNLPFILDEIADDIDMLMRIHRDDAADAINIKISKYGGLTRAAQVGKIFPSVLKSDLQRKSTFELYNLES